MSSDQWLRIAAAHCHCQYSKLDPQWMILYAYMNVYTQVYSTSLHMHLCVYMYVYTQIETVVFVSVKHFLTHESKVKLLLP